MMRRLSAWALAALLGAGGLACDDQVRVKVTARVRDAGVATATTTAQ
ncbi:MAG: hypothetical protein H6730_18135 [Deltaproteobacteria bacterium]|nr:hypothetical protein [Deltaproteobacteria bacterium]